MVRCTEELEALGETIIRIAEVEAHWQTRAHECQIHGKTESCDMVNTLREQANSLKINVMIELEAIEGCFARVSKGE